MKPRDRKILVAIHDLVNQHGYSPSMDEIAERADVPNKGVVYRAIHRLREDGLVTFLPGQSRTVRVTADGEIEAYRQVAA